MVVLGALALLVTLVVVALVANQRVEKPRLWPTEAELSQPDRAARLIGEWVYEGSIDHEYGEFRPAEGKYEESYTDGLMVVHSDNDSDGQRSAWAIEPDGRLRLDGDDGSIRVPDFFFRGDKLYIEGDSAWDQYRRR